MGKNSKVAKHVATEPPAPNIGGRPPKYPWLMPVGHSFFVAPEEGNPSLDSLRSMVSYAGRKRGTKYTVAVLADGRFQVYRSR